jgi:DNA repair protein RadA/Sms
VSVREVAAEAARAWPTGVGELDRVLGGGIVPGSAVLVAGEPGVGKSTLLLDVAARAAAGGRSVLYLSGEESLAQVAARAERIGADHPALRLAAACDLDQVAAVVGEEGPELLVIDSIQTIGWAQASGVPGGTSLVRAVTAELVGAAKARSMACLLVGHVTKDGQVAGPRTIEHLVDAVLMFEGERDATLRWLRATKNRFGAADEVGCFQMAEDGIEEVADPSGLFLEDPAHPVAGTCAGVTLEGLRPMGVAVQALTAAGPKKSKPARACIGLESGRLALVLAVLQARANVGLRALDVYVSTVGGVKCPDPAMDLPLALACVSARFGLPLPPGVVAIGEVGLAGQLREVKGTARRLAEAQRLGFRRALVPPLGAKTRRAVPAGLELVELGTLAQAVHLLGEAAAEAVAKPAPARAN